MREIAVLRQKFGMRQGGLRQAVTPLQFAQLRFFALMVYQIKKLLLALGRPSVGGEGYEKRKKGNGGDGPVHVQSTLYVRSCYFFRAMEVMLLRRRQRRAKYSPKAIPAPRAI